MPRPATVLLMRLAASLAATLTTPVLAHTGPGTHDTMLEGLMHPMAGFDHLLVMLGVGVLAMAIGGRARWALPATFVGVMALSAIVALAGYAGSVAAEHLLALSVLLVGAPLAWSARLPLSSAIALVAVCAAVHGQAHGVEAAGQASLAGMLLATALLHAAGAGIGASLARLVPARFQANRVLGAAMVLAGLALVAT